MTKTNDIQNNNSPPAEKPENPASAPPAALVYSPHAAKKQAEIIGWRKMHFPKNRKEQGGWLIGNYVVDESGAVVRAEVTDVLEASTECRFPGYIEWDGREEIRLQQMYFDMKDKLAETDPAASESLTVLGWWHTHPNSLDIFLSETDMETVCLKYYKPNQFSVVLNPHREIIKAFAGGDAIETPVIWDPDGNGEEGRPENDR